LGGGGGGWERQREITVHEIYILVPKGINKDSEPGSVQGTQGMITAWIFATTVAGFLGFRIILLPYSQVQYTVYDFLMHYLHFNNFSPLRTVFKTSYFIIILCPGVYSYVPHAKYVIK
jgi:hypothetical protein